MVTAAEISKYPLNADYEPAILDFIARINKYDALTVVTNTLSTQIYGPHEIVMNAVSTEMKHSWEKYGKAVFVCKFLHGDFSPSLNG